MDEIYYEYDIKRLSLDKQRKDTLLTFRAISPKHALAQAIRSSQGKLINNLNRDDRIVVELGTRFGEKKLPNCPNCGAKPILHRNTGVDKRVVCKNCDWGWEDSGDNTSESNEELTPEERMAAQSKRPVVFPSTSPEHGKNVVRTAVTWVKIVPDEYMNGKDMIADKWEARKQATKNTPGTSLSWDDVAEDSGMDIVDIAATMKAIHRQNPNIIVFDVDRMGNNVGFHIKDVAAFRAVTTKSSEGIMKRDEPESVRKARAQGRAGMPPQVGWGHGSEEMRAWAQGRKEWGKTMMRMDQKIDKVIDTLLEQDDQVKTLVARRGRDFYEKFVNQIDKFDSVAAMATAHGYSEDQLITQWMYDDTEEGPVLNILKRQFPKGPQSIKVHSIRPLRPQVEDITELNAYVNGNEAYIIPEDPETGEPIDSEYFS